jgi:hypothetical protein
LRPFPVRRSPKPQVRNSLRFKPCKALRPFPARRSPKPPVRNSLAFKTCKALRPFPARTSQAAGPEPFGPRAEDVLRFPLPPLRPGNFGALWATPPPRRDPARRAAAVSQANFSPEAPTRQTLRPSDTPSRPALSTPPTPSAACPPFGRQRPGPCGTGPGQAVSGESSAGAE